MTDWREGLSDKDWLMDGRPIRGDYALDRFLRLDWSKAWVDIGPSVAGNLGPYWHVPMDDGDTTHRLYPKILQTKWLLLIRQACEEYAKIQVKRAQPEYLSGCQLRGPGECQKEGKCMSASCDHYGKTEYRARMTVLAQTPGILYPRKDS